MGQPALKLEPAAADAVGVQSFIFLLLPGFSSLDLGAGIESLAAANAAKGLVSFSWTIVSEAGAPVASSSGVKVAVDGALPKTSRNDCVVICAPLGKNQPISAELKMWLHRTSRFGAHLCGLGGGAAVLAHAGFTMNGRMSTHWKLQPALSEMFPHLDPVCSVFEDDSIATCGGGATTLDFFSAMISRKCGAEVASSVADLLLHASVRTSGDRQTRSDLCRLGKRNEKLGQAIQIMQENLEDPLSPTQIAEEVGLSTRQLERLFKRYVGASPKTYMTDLRLERARLLLLQTHMRVIDVAIACGFTSASHFARHYRRKFDISPQHERGAVK